MFFSLTTLIPSVLLLSTALAAPIETNVNATFFSERDILDNKDAGVTLYAFSSVNCGGVETLLPLTYNNQMTGTLRSYKLSRDMKEGEVFDFSTGPGQDWASVGFGKRDYAQPGADYTIPSECSAYDQTAEPLTKGKHCWTLDKSINCARFWHR